MATESGGAVIAGRFTVFGHEPDGHKDVRFALPELAPEQHEAALRAAWDLARTAKAIIDAAPPPIPPESFESAIRKYRDATPGKEDERQRQRITALDQKIYACRVGERLLRQIGESIPMPNEAGTNAQVDARARELLRRVLDAAQRRGTVLDDAEIAASANVEVSDAGPGAEPRRTRSSEMPAFVPPGSAADHLARAYHAALFSVNVLGPALGRKVLPLKSVFPPDFFDWEAPGYEPTPQRRAERSNRKAFAELAASNVRHTAPKENWRSAEVVFAQAEELLRVVTEAAAAEGLDAYAHGPAAMHPAFDASRRETRPVAEVPNRAVTQDELVSRFASVTRAMPQTTEAERLVVERVGQDLFRDALRTRWGDRCAISGLAIPALLRASHIKPWSRCESDAERLDPSNGLLLAAHLDAAFDAGLISVSDAGDVLVSGALSPDARQVLGLVSPCAIQGLTNENRSFLAWHRHHIFDFRSLEPATGRES